MAPRSTIRPDGTKPCPKCTRCLPLAAFYTSGKTTDGATKYNSWCKDCAKVKMASYHKRTWGPEALQHTAFKRTRSLRAYLSYLRAKAVGRGGSCLPVDELLVLWELQCGRCALTGWDMSMVLGRGVVPTNASIDRIDSAKGYVLGNVQLVCRCANVAKQDLGQQDFISLCRAIVENANGLQDARVAA